MLFIGEWQLLLQDSFTPHIVPTCLHLNTRQQREERGFRTGVKAGQSLMREKNESLLVWTLSLHIPTITRGEGGRAGKWLSWYYEVCHVFGCRSRPHPDARRCPAPGEWWLQQPGAQHLGTVIAFHFCRLERLLWVCGAGFSGHTTSSLLPLLPTCPLPSFRAPEVTT